MFEKNTLKFRKQLFFKPNATTTDLIDLSCPLEMRLYCLLIKEGL